MRFFWVNMFVRVSIAVSCLLLASGCSTHPLPEDYSRAATIGIVRKIRCEAQYGMRSANTNLSLKDATIGYLFDFTMTENDNATSGLLEFANPFVGGKFSLALSGKAEKERETQRTFVLTESFAELDRFDQCDGPKLAANLVYPIAGSIGVDETLSTYLRLEHDLKFKTYPNKEGVFSDKLKFTTTLNAGIKPTLELNSGANSFRLRKASIDGNMTRKDVHQVIIALAYAPPTPAQRRIGLEAVPYSTLRATRAAPPQPDSSSKSLVIQELYRLRSLEEDKKIFDQRFLPQ